MKKQQPNYDKKKEIMEKIVILRDSIGEEYDLLELVEDSIKDIFQCDLDCSTCSSKEQGMCMSNFRKANLYWLRKIAQDEWALKNFTDKIGELYTMVEGLTGIIITELKSTKAQDEFDKVVDKRKQLTKKHNNSDLYS